jgi:hypothetical protein
MPEGWCSLLHPVLADGGADSVLPEQEKVKELKSSGVGVFKKKCDPVPNSPTNFNEQRERCAHT